MLERMTPEAKKVIGQSLAEALRLGHSYIGAEHILLALLRDAEDVPCRALWYFGITPKAMRNAVIEVLREDMKEKREEPAFSPELVRELTLAVERELLRRQWNSPGRKGT